MVAKTHREWVRKRYGGTDRKVREGSRSINSSGGGGEEKVEKKEERRCKSERGMRKGAESAREGGG